MTYIKHNFKDGEILSAKQMNDIDDGILNIENMNSQNSENLQNMQTQLANQSLNIEGINSELSDIPQTYANVIRIVSEYQTKHEELNEGRQYLQWDTSENVGIKKIATSVNILPVHPQILGNPEGVDVSFANGLIFINGTIEGTGNADVFCADETKRGSFFSKVRGAKAKFITMGTNGTIKLICFKTDYSNVQLASNWTNDGSYKESSEFTIPSDANYFRVSFQLQKGIELDKKIFVGVYVSDGLPHDYVDGEETDYKTIDTLYYPTKVTTLAETKSYVENNGGSNIVTPEKFGAKGDGDTDDTEAINSAIQYAKERGILNISMDNIYKTTDSIIIDGGLKVVINEINCTSDNASAVVVTGNFNKVDIKKITSNFCGIEFLTATHNQVNVNLINAVKCGIGFHQPSNGMSYQNTVHFSMINCSDEDSIAISTLGFFENIGYSSENNFYGGQIQSAFGYKGWGSNNKFFGIQMENVRKISWWFVGSSYAVVIADRHAEQVMNLNYPYIKIQNSDPSLDYEVSRSAGGSGLLFLSTRGIPINKIDVSENFIKIKNAEDSYEEFISEKCTSRIMCPIDCGYMQEENGAYTEIAKEALLWGRRIICKPIAPSRFKLPLSLPNNTYDMRNNDNTTNILPTIFIADTNNFVIYLHDSYCHLGINSFSVIQKNNGTCIVFDSDENIIFDGTNKGNGTYTLTQVATNENGFDTSYRCPLYDGSGLQWIES